MTVLVLIDGAEISDRCLEASEEEAAAYARRRRNYSYAPSNIPQTQVPQPLKGRSAR